MNASIEAHTPFAAPSWTRWAPNPFARFWSTRARIFNTGPQGDPDRWLDELARHVATLTSASPESISLVDWSLGGIDVREVAKRLGTRVRHVVTVGTPFAGSADQTNAGLVYRVLNEVNGSHCGLGWNAEVFGVLADRLSQPHDGWQRYAPRATESTRSVS